MLLPVIGLLSAALFLSSAQADAVGHTATIQDYSFGPTPLSIAAGESVTWTNSGPSQHTVSADDGTSFDSSPGCPNTTLTACLAVNQAFSHTFTAPGHYPYHCNIHPSMKGAIEVAAPMTTSTVPPSTVQPTTTVPLSPSTTASSTPPTTARAAPGATPTTIGPPGGASGGGAAGGGSPGGGAVTSRSAAISPVSVASSGQAHLAQTGRSRLPVVAVVGLVLLALGGAARRRAAGRRPGA